MGSATRYTRSGDLHIAYQAAGDGGRDILYVPTWVGQLEILVEEPSIHAFIERMCSFSRVLSRAGAGLASGLQLSEPAGSGGAG